MALATKCPHCHTVFRVALDQLKLRGGIVRCGACNEIFDGNAALVATAAPAIAAVPTASAAAAPAAPRLDLELDLDDDIVADDGPAAAHAPGPVPAGPPPAPAPAPAVGLAAGTSAVPRNPPPVSQGQGPLTAADHEQAGDALPEPGHVDIRREPAFDMPSEHIVAVALDDLHHFDDEPEPIVPHRAPKDDAGHATGMLASEAAERAADDAAAAPDSALPDSALPTAGADDAAPARDDGAARDDGTTWDELSAQDDEPEFVRQAERRERSRRLARLAMLAGIPLLALALLGQGVHTLRNRLAADYPDLKPMLQALCAPLNCTVGLPRQIDALAIEQGELQTLVPGTFSFATVLRNQSRSVQAWPHIELTLNDAADKPVLRRVFAPRDYLDRNAVGQGFRPRSEQAVKLFFELDRLRASGYHIAIFYP